MYKHWNWYISLYIIHEFHCGWLKMEMQQSLYASLIDRCSSEASISREWLLSGQESLVAWLDDDRWCQWDKPTSWIKCKEMWHWRIAWTKSFIWSNSSGLVSSFHSWRSAWHSYMTEFPDSLEIGGHISGKQNAQNILWCFINQGRTLIGGYYVAPWLHSFFWFFKNSGHLLNQICLGSWNKKTARPFTETFCNTNKTQSNLLGYN